MKREVRYLIRCSIKQLVSSGKLQGMGCSQALACQCDDNDNDDGKAATSHTHPLLKSESTVTWQDSFAKAFAKRSKTMASFRVSSFEDLSTLSDGGSDEAMEFVRHFYQEAVINGTRRTHLGKAEPLLLAPISWHVCRRGSSGMLQPMVAMVHTNMPLSCHNRCQNRTGRRLVGGMDASMLPSSSRSHRCVACASLRT